MLLSEDGLRVSVKNYSSSTVLLAYLVKNVMIISIKFLIKKIVDSTCINGHKTPKY